MCFACHAPDGLGTPKPELATTMAPPLAGSPRVNGHRDYIIKTVLHGLGGPVDGKTYTDMMIPMSNNDDEWIAAVALVRPPQLRQHRRLRHAGRRRACAGRERRPQNAVDASGADRVAAGAALHRRLEADGEPQSGGRDRRASRLTTWNSGGQEPGMWFQVELPRAGDGHRNPVSVAGARRP